MLALAAKSAQVRGSKKAVSACRSAETAMEDAVATGEPHPEA